MTLTGSGGNANVDTTSGAVTFAGQLSGSGGLNKIGGGALTLTGNNSYTGTTTVSCGTFKVDNSAGSATGSGPVTVNAGATLSGSGIIGGPLEIAGALGPGDSTEILTVNNQVTFRPGSALNAVVSGTAAGSGYDQLTTTGPVSLAGSLNVTFGAFTPNDNDILFLINNSGALSGTFQYADKAEIGTYDGFNWYITYEANDAGAPSLSGGNDVAIYSVRARAIDADAACRRGDRDGRRHAAAEEAFPLRERNSRLSAASPHPGPLPEGEGDLVVHASETSRTQRRLSPCSPFPFSPFPLFTCSSHPSEIART